MAFRGPSRRDDRFDFLRGLALLIIFVDHVPKNLFEPFTMHSIAFCDAAEVFFFISGYVAAMVYGRVMQRKGFVAATKKVWRRAGVVYAYQLLLMFAVLALVWVFLHATGDQTYRWIFRIQWVFEAPLAYVLPALTMHFQPGYLDILPAYVVLLALFPAVLWAMTRNVWLVLLPSFALWLAVQFTGLTLWTTAGERWFFNPFAWQFLFAIGAAFGHPTMAGKFAFLDSKWVLRAAVAVCVPIALVQLSDLLSHTVAWMPSYRPETMLLDKTGLGAARLVSFFALAVIARRLLPASGVLSDNRFLMPVIRCGRSSLQVFSLGALLSSITAVTWVLTAGNVALQTFAAVLGVAVQLWYAVWRDKRKEAAAGFADVPVLADPAVEPVPVSTDPPRCPPAEQA